MIKDTCCESYIFDDLDDYNQHSHKNIIITLTINTNDVDEKVSKIIQKIMRNNFKSE